MEIERKLQERRAKMRGPYSKMARMEAQQEEGGGTTAQAQAPGEAADADRCG